MRDGQRRFTKGKRTSQGPVAAAFYAAHRSGPPGWLRRNSGAPSCARPRRSAAFNWQVAGLRADSLQLQARRLMEIWCWKFHKKKRKRNCCCTGTLCSSVPSLSLSFALRPWRRGSGGESAAVVCLQPDERTTARLRRELPTIWIHGLIRSLNAHIGPEFC